MGLLDNNINGYNRARVFEKLNNLSKYNKKYFVAHGTHDDNVHFQQSMVGIRIEKYNKTVHLTIIISNQCYSNNDFDTLFLKQLLSAALEEKDILFRQHAYPDQDHGIGMYHQHLYHTLTDFFQNDCFRDI